VACLVSEIREVRVKRGKMAGENMGILKLEDATGQVEMVSFPEHYREYQALLKSSKPLLVRAELDFEEDKPKLIGSQMTYAGGVSVEDLTEVREKWPTRIRIGVDIDALEGRMSLETLYGEIAGILKKYHGTIPVGLNLRKAGAFMTQLDLPEAFSVHPDKSLLKELEQIVALPGALRVEALHQ
jgi:DNA polymerase III alpha subunit